MDMLGHTARDHRIRGLTSLAMLALAGTLGCGGDDIKCGGPFCVSPGPPEASRLEPNSGTGQEGPPNRVLPDPVRVKVTDDKGRPVSGVTVTFSSGQGGSVSEPAVESNAEGLAEVEWILGPEPGEQELLVSAESEPGDPLENSPLKVSARAIPQPPSQIVFQTPPPDAAQNGVPFGPQPVLAVLDAEDQPVAGATVNAAIASGEQTLVGTTAVITDASGLATFTDLAIVGVSGPRTIRFSVSEPALEVTSGIIQLTAGTAAEMTGVAPLSYQGVVGSPVTPAPSVLVKDATGNPVAGVAVNFTTDRDASVAPAAVVSNEDGIARVTSWTLGTTANVQYSLTATVPSSSLQPVVFTATARPGAAGRLQIITQPASSAQNGAPLSTQPVIQITDQNGNPAPQGNVRVTASVSSGSGDVSNAVATTNASGRATFSGLTISGTVGTYTLSFSARELAGATSAPITLAAGPATRLALISPAPAAQSRVPLSPQPAIQVQDASGNPVARAGLPVVAQLSGNARLDGTTTVTTDAAGTATFTDLTVTGAPGALTLGFSSPEVGTSASTPVTLPAPTAIEVSKPAPPSAPVGTAILAAPAWVLRDASGKTVSDVPVTLTASAGTVAGSAGSGEGGGVQVDNWTLGTAAGPQTLTITVTGTSLSNTVTVEATPGPATPLQIVSGNNQTDSTPNGVLDSLLVVRLTDQFGNGISDVIIQWRTCDGAGTYDNPTASDGSSSADIPTPEAGSFCIRATTTGLETNSSVDFNYTVTDAGASAASLEATQGSVTQQAVPRAPARPGPRR